MEKKRFSTSVKGFTLIELLVVVTIVAILATVVIVVMNPLTIVKRGRNDRRLADLATVKKALDLALSEASASGAIGPLTPGMFVSGPCGGGTPGSQSVDGTTGWIQFNAARMNLRKYLSALPIDPLNNGVFCYWFIAAADGLNYKLLVTLEAVGDATQTMANDGGTRPDSVNFYEVGSLMSL